MFFWKRSFCLVSVIKGYVRKNVITSASNSQPLLADSGMHYNLEFLELQLENNYLPYFISFVLYVLQKSIWQVEETSWRIIKTYLLVGCCVVHFVTSTIICLKKRPYSCLTEYTNTQNSATRPKQTKRGLLNRSPKRLVLRFEIKFGFQFNERIGRTIILEG